MARIVVGKICKSKDPEKPDYIKIDQDFAFKKGEFVNLENKKSQLASLQKAVELGKISAENAEKSRERIEKTPDWIRFELVVYE